VLSVESKRKEESYMPGESSVGDTMITILLADDHAVVRSGIRDFLSQDNQIRIVAETGNGDQALALAQALQPDVLVLDIQMPGKTGIEVTHVARAGGSRAGILILTAYDDEPFVMGALQAGANGYVLKTAEPEELIEAVHAVYEGKSVLDHQLTGKLMHRLIGMGQAKSALATETLSEREIEVLGLAARGYTNKAIAAQLKISDRTVQGHMANIFAKLHAQSRTDAVMTGLRMGLLNVGATFRDTDPNSTH
jgi:DNA-binding NarL/FixJ family response regulator